MAFKPGKRLSANLGELRGGLVDIALSADQQAVLEGGDAQPIRCEFMYRIPESAEAKLNLGLRIVDKAYIEKDTLDAVVAGIRDNTGLPVYLGDTKNLGASQ